MAAIFLTATFSVFLALAYVAWRRYLWAAQRSDNEQKDDCPYSLSEVPGNRQLVNIPHQQGVKWLGELFSRSAHSFPDHTALQIPSTGESLTFAELDARAEAVATALSPLLTGPDQVVGVAMAQDNWQIVAAHLGILRAGGTLMFLDTALPDPLIKHMLDDAKPVAILTRGQTNFRDLPTLDVLALPDTTGPRKAPDWLDDPAQRLASIFYTSGTTGMPKGVECHHAGYVNLALSYADYFDLIPGVDATSLTSSLGYDGSISEMYSAWVSGCAVVMLTKEEVRSGPDLVPVLCDAEVTVLFCPPVLLTTLTASPERDLPHPICRYVVPAGEAFPSTLVEPWTRGRRQVINTYGPTEASTDTSRQSLRPGEAVTIGSPLANVNYVILQPGDLQPLVHGETGELCIGGVHVARGYRNLPQQTAEKFIDHPQFGRLYRTGDLAKIDIQTQRVHFLGRIDAQLKVRGHRVEVQAVEDILHNQFGEIEAAVLDYQNRELVAFIAAPSIRRDDASIAVPAPREWAAEVRQNLARQLPEPSVPARIFLVEKFDLKPTSGKIDRERLPRLAELAADGGPHALSKAGDAGGGSAGIDRQACGDAALNGCTEPGSQEVLEICRAVLEANLGWDDTFSDNGGHSIAIAQLTQRLQDAGWPVTVRALLSHCDTPRKVTSYRPQPSQAAQTEQNTGDETPQHCGKRDENASRVLGVGFFTTLQLLLLSLLYAPPLIAFLAVVGSAEIGEFFMTGGLLEFLGIGVVMYLTALAAPFGSLLWVMVIKRCLGGDIYRNSVTPGVYPRWSRMHLRTWYIGRLERSVLVPLRTMFRSAPLMSFALRQLGASVGNNLQCAHDADFSGPLDLLCIEDDVAIQTGAYLHMTQWQGQELHIGQIHLERGCKIGMRAAIAGNVTVGHGSWITPFTPILASVGAQEMWTGAPAHLAGRCVELKRTARECQYNRPLWFLETLNLLMHVLLDFLLLIVPTALVTWTAVLFIPVSEAQLASEYFRVTPLPEVIWHMGLYAFLTTWFTVTLVSVLGCLFLRCTAMSPGLYPSRGLKCALLMYRMVKMNQIQRHWTWTITGQYLRALAGLRFTRLGASECDVMFNLVPELASADAQVFWSNGCFTNMLDYGAEHTKLRRLDMPRNFFSGNNSVAESGQFPSNFLLGVSTPGSDIQFRRQMQSQPGKPITVAGNPPVKFASARFEEENESHKMPTFGLFLGRVFLNDVFSIGILPIANVLTYVVVYTNLLRMDGHPVASALVALVIAEILLVMACAAIKKLLVGSNWGSEHSAPFWSWRHFSYFFAQDCYFAWCRLPLAFSAGTTMSNTILRSMGCRIGKRTILNSPLQASDWNAVSFGDDCMIEGYLQFHTFEDMTLKVRRTHIENGSNVNFGATVMGGAVIDAGTTLQPLSMVLKQMYLPAGTYHGSPVETAAAEIE